ncbi:MAG TPA: hypothetical protein HA224_04765 [Nanoarchaeota archaeon]|nr:hypothetical protein [Nanoarchaeota archaeon]
MALRKPGANDKLAYFTRRDLPNMGKATVWQFEGEELANIEYACPFCKHIGEKQQAFARVEARYVNDKGKSKKGEVFRFQCDACRKDIDLPKWVKKRGRKKAE